jgi:hypothetical protein
MSRRRVLLITEATEALFVIWGLQVLFFSLLALIDDLVLGDTGRLSL